MKPSTPVFAPRRLFASPRWLRLMLLLLWLPAWGCSPVPEGDLDDDGGVAAGLPAAFATDQCDDSTFADAVWQTRRTAHFDLHYLPGTAAAADIDDIAASREEAYAAIRVELGLGAEPTLDVYLSPNRRAASAHGLRPGFAFPAADRYEVVYSGEADSYEVTRPGYLMTQVLSAKLAPEGRHQLPILERGLAELLDQSGRDLHDAYAGQIRVAGAPHRSAVELVDDDVRGMRSEAAGSLVQLIVEHHGMETLLGLLRDTAAPWAQSCYRDASARCIETGAQLAARLDTALERWTGERWNALQRSWMQRLDERLKLAVQPVGAEDLAAVTQLIRGADAAFAARDAEAYRATMDGFYCGWADDKKRSETARAIVEDGESVRTQVVAVHPTSVKNFPTMRVEVRRHAADGATSTRLVDVEHFPVGWRVTWDTEWR